MEGTSKISALTYAFTLTRAFKENYAITIFHEVTITCISLYIKNYALRHGLSKKPITKTWGYHLAEQVVMPVLGVNSVMLSVYWAAKVFNLSDLCWKIFNYKFINLENLNVSIFKLSVVTPQFFRGRSGRRTVQMLGRCGTEGQSGRYA